MPDDKSPLETTETDKTEASEAAVVETPAQDGKPAVVALAFIGIALSGVLIMMALKSGVLEKSPPAEDRLSALQAQMEAARGDINRQRAALGQPPLEGGSESIDDIAVRLKNDADSLVTLAEGSQRILSDKDAVIAAKSMELVNSEKMRIALSAENTRLKEELLRSAGSGSDAEILRADLAALRTQRDALSEELTATKAKLGTMSAGVSADDFADLNRRYDETLRAKEFFEARVKELEGGKE